MNDVSTEIRVWGPGVVKDAGRIAARALFIAAAILSIDLAATWIPVSKIAFLQGVVALDANANARHQLIVDLLTVVGFAPPVVIALTSFAVTGLSQYGNPSFLLLYRWRRRRWWLRVLGVWSGPSNPLHRSLVLSLALVSSLVLLRVTYEIHWTSNASIAVFLVFVLGAIFAVDLIWLMMWILMLRRPSDAIATMLSMGYDVLDYVTRLPPATQRLRLYEGPCLSDTGSRYEVQEQIRRCLQGLTEMALRALEQQQRVAALNATNALEHLDRHASGAHFPGLWILLGPGGGLPQPDWLQDEFVHAFESISVEATSLQYSSVGTPAINSITQIGGRMVRDQTNEWPGRDRILKGTVSALANICDECVRTADFILRDVVLNDVFQVLDAWPSGMDVNGGDFFRDKFTLMGVRAVHLDDITSVRALLRHVDEIAGRGRLDVDAWAGAILSLGASALASRRHACATALIDHAARMPWCGTSLVKVTQARWEHRGTCSTLPYVPSYATWDYGVMFSLIVAARAIALKQNWSKLHRAAFQGLASQLENPKHWGRVTVQRMAKAGSYPEEDIDPWVAALNEFIGSCRPSASPSTRSWFGRQPA